MGDIRLISEGIPDLLPMRHRAPGLHVSDIIRSLCIHLGHYADDGIPLADKMTRLQLGQAMEWALIQRMQLHEPTRYFQPGELSLDGVSGNMDLFDLQDEAVDEMKLTWMSAKHDAYSQKFWAYWVQIAAYCHMSGSSIGRLHVAFVNGDYAGEREPQFKVWEQRFTPMELAKNWAMLKQHARRAGLI